MNGATDLLLKMLQLSGFNVQSKLNLGFARVLSGYECRSQPRQGFQKDGHSLFTTSNRSNWRDRRGGGLAASETNAVLL